MKKIFTLIIALAMTSMANAQLHFIHDGQEIESGSTFVSSHLNEFYKNVLGKLVIEPEIFLKSDVDASNMIVEAKTTNDVEFQFCFGVKCATAKEHSIEDAIIKDKLNDLQIHAGSATTPLETVLTCKVFIKAYYKGKESEAVTLNLIMSNDPEVLSGINGVEADNNAPIQTYNVGGRTSANGKGLVIVKQGNTVKKVVR